MAPRVLFATFLHYDFTPTHFDLKFHRQENHLLISKVEHEKLLRFYYYRIDIIEKSVINSVLKIDKNF
jgi:kynurenine formamidase